MTIFNSSKTAKQFSELYDGLDSEEKKSVFSSAIKGAFKEKMYGDEVHDEYSLTEKDVVEVYDRLFTIKV